MAPVKDLIHEMYAEKSASVLNKNLPKSFENKISLGANRQCADCRVMCSLNKNNAYFTVSFSRLSFEFVWSAYEPEIYT